MTLSSMLADLYRKLNYASTPASDVTVRLTAFLNEIQTRVAGLSSLSVLRRGQITLTTVASTPQYSLPPDVAGVIGIRDATNDGVLAPQSWAWYQANEPDPTGTTGTPSIWCPAGLSAVAAQPADASKVYVDSTSASDVGTCTVEGIRTGGYPFSTDVTMTGTTAVQVGAWTDILAITKFTISAAAVGTVTLHEDAEGGTELARIAIGQTSARYLRIALWPTPSSALSLTLDYARQITDLALPNDEPMLPQDFHWVLTAGARMLEYEKQEDTRYALAKAEFERGVKELKWWATTQSGLALSRSMPSAGSQLGAWYPAGS